MDSPAFPLRSVFLALPLGQEAKRQFQALQDSLRPFQNIFRFQNPRSPHLTLSFWREVMEIEWRDIVERARAIASKAAPFTLRCTGVSTFGAGGEDNVLFLNVSFSDALAGLKKQCSWPNETPFFPHVTLARITHPRRFAAQKKNVLKALGAAACLTIAINRLRLYAEVEGRKQTPLKEFVLGEQ